MKTKFAAMSVLLFAFAGAFSQSPLKVYTSPKLPLRDSLERMSLTMAWHARVGVDGQRDGIASLQLIPGKSNQLVVQTFKGSVFLLDAETGDLIWKTAPVNVPYWEMQPAAWNTDCILVTRRNTLHVLNRFTGAQRVYYYQEFQRDPTYGFTLQFAPSAVPIADEDFVYICMASRVNSIYVPDFEGLERAKKAAGAFEKAKGKDKDEKKAPAKEEIVPEKKYVDSPQPFVYWAYRAIDHIDTPVLLAREQIGVLTTSGILVGMNRFQEGPRRENFEFEIKGATPGGATQHGPVAYFGATDFNVYAVNLLNGNLAWRHVAGASILTRPDVNDKDLFVAPERLGLRKLDRASGREAWTNRDVERFLAANNQFVYARDRLGRFFVLDAKRGTTLAGHDFADWTIAYANEYSDRVYLAAHDGQIICLRHRDLVKPLVMKTPDVFQHMPDKKGKDDKKNGKPGAMRFRNDTWPATTVGGVLRLEASWRPAMDATHLASWTLR